MLKAPQGVANGLELADRSLLIAARSEAYAKEAHRSLLQHWQSFSKNLLFYSRHKTFLLSLDNKKLL